MNLDGRDVVEPLLGAPSSMWHEALSVVQRIGALAAEEVLQGTRGIFAPRMASAAARCSAPDL